MQEKPTISLQQDLLEGVKTNNAKVLEQLYVSNYPKIELFVLKNSGTRDQAKDIFQDAFLTVWQNIKQDKFVPRSESSVEAYIYTIAKNKWMDVLRSKGFKNTVTTSQLSNFQLAEEENQGIDDDILRNQRLKDVMAAFKDLGEACQNLLRMFYFERKSMNLIAEVLQLDSASTRNKKYRCMKKLKHLALDKN